MTNEQFDHLISELRIIRDLLGKTQAPAPVLGAVDAAFASEARDAFKARPPIPQPTYLVDDPDAVEVHFGKNSGTPLGQLGERSIEWYASVKEPKLDRTGKPFAPRPADVALENAARQIIHRRRNTLTTTATQPAVAKLDDFDSGEAF